MSTKFAVVSIWAEDVLTCAHFYRDVLGLNLLPHHADRLHFDVNGIYLTIIKGKPMPWGVEGNSASRWMMFHDPAGNLIELVQFNG